MPRHEVDNFTQIVKHEIILNKYKDDEFKLLLYGYFFQEVSVGTKELHFKFNLISDFVLSKFIEIIKIPPNSIQKKNKTVIIKNLNVNDDYWRFVLKIENFIDKIKNHQISKKMLWSFLSGWFLKSGSINNLSAKSYHLELKLKAYEFYNLILNAIKHYDISFKSLIRKRFAVFYLKKIDLISDFLKKIRAQNSMMQLEEKRIIKDSNNHIQRWENLDISNALKSNATSEMQIATINELKKRKIYDSLDDKTKLICALRIKYKNYSLHDLTNKINEHMQQNNFISKSSVAYTLKKIKKYL